MYMYNLRSYVTCNFVMAKDNGPKKKRQRANFRRKDGPYIRIRHMVCSANLLEQVFFLIFYFLTFFFDINHKDTCHEFRRCWHYMYLRRMVLEKHSVNEVTGSLTRDSQDLFVRSVARSEGVSISQRRRRSWINWN
jgi:hypothetical protein